MIKLLKTISNGLPDVRCKVYFKVKLGKKGMVFNRYFSSFKGDEGDESSFMIIFSGFLGKSCYYMQDLDILRIDFEVCNKGRLLGWVGKCNMRRRMGHYVR